MSIITNLNLGSGISGVIATANVNPATNNTMYECTSNGGMTISLPPVPLSGGTIGIMDAAGTCSATNFIRITPATGQSLDGYPVNDSVLMDYPGANTIAYAAAGATSWKLQKQATTSITPGMQTGQTTGAAIGVGFVGQEIISTNSAGLALGTASTYQDVTSINVTPGVWDICGQVYISAGSANSLTAGVSTTSASQTGTVNGLSRLSASYNATSGTGSVTINPFRINVTTTTPYYLISQTAATSGNTYGTVRAIRIA